MDNSGLINRIFASLAVVLTQAGLIVESCKTMGTTINYQLSTSSAIASTEFSPKDSLGAE